MNGLFGYNQMERKIFELQKEYIVIRSCLLA
jgi:hypothetical protein